MCKQEPHQVLFSQPILLFFYKKGQLYDTSTVQMYGPNCIAKPLAFCADPSPCWKVSKNHGANIRGGENRSRRLFCKYLVRRLQQKWVFHHPFPS